MAADLACARVGGEFGVWKDVLPEPFAAGVRVFASQGKGQVDAAVAFAQVVVVRPLYVAQVFAEKGNNGVGQQGGAVFFPLGVTHDDLLAVKIDVLDTQLPALA